MNNQEAIELLQNIESTGGRFSDRQREAVQMAIEALQEQRPKFYISKDVDQKKLAGMIKNFPPIFVAPGTEKIEIIREQRWIPITSRPMDEEEREEWSDKLGYELDDEEAVIYGSLPDDGQTVLVCHKYWGVAMDTFCQDECGCYFEENEEMDGIVAWMPLPEPYTEE